MKIVRWKAIKAELDDRKIYVQKCDSYVSTTQWRLILRPLRVTEHFLCVFCLLLENPWEI